LAGTYRQFSRKTQLNDAFIESYRVYGWGYVLNHPVAEENGGYAGEGEMPRSLSRLEFFARLPYLSRCDLSES
jgi:hypothetical protein